MEITLPELQSGDVLILAIVVRETEQDRVIDSFSGDGWRFQYGTHVAADEPDYPFARTALHFRKDIE